ncbi:MAG: transglutaminase domain-containing protein [Anaerolineae bacterium]
MAVDIILYLRKQIRPQEGWLPFFLLALAVVCLPLSIAAAGWLPRTGWLLPLSIAGMLLGLRLGQGKHTNWSLTIAAIGGVALVGLLIGGVIPSPSAAISAVTQTGLWMARGAVGEWPAKAFALDSLARISDFGSRLGAFANLFQAPSAATDAPDPLPIMWLAYGTLWLASLWAGWSFRRWHYAGVALLPLGVLLTNHLVFARSGGFYYGAFLAATLALMVQGRFLRLVDRWTRTNADYSDEIHIDVTVVTIALVLIIPLLAWATPLPILYGPARAAWEATISPREAVGSVAKRVLGDVNRPGSDEERVDLGDLPLSRVLGGPPELAASVIFTVQTSDPPPVPDLREDVSHYYRTHAWDVYTGRGWAASDERGERTAGSAIDTTLTDLPPGVRLTQRYSLVENIEPPVVNSLVAVDQSYERVEHPSGDLTAIRVASKTYTIVSRLPFVSENQLRQAPPDARAEYLALPDTLPTRVRDLALSLTANARTDYDRATAIERYLRTYRYDLNVSAPPPGRDVVDYFLFDSKAGYCDYTASAMVVLLRAAGVPSRLATGYAGGSFDYRRNAYVITGEQGHAWPEVYFSGIGWVEFEPTPSQPLPGRAFDPTSLPSDEALREVAQPAGPGAWTVLAGLLGVGFIVAAGVILYGRYQESRIQPEERVSAAWSRLVERATRLRHGPSASQTPREYAESLGGELAQRSARVGPWSLDGGAAADILAGLSETYNQAAYSAHPPTEAQQRAAFQAAKRVRRALWLFVLDRLRVGGERDSAP